MFLYIVLFVNTLLKKVLQNILLKKVLQNILLKKVLQNILLKKVLQNTQNWGWGSSEADAPWGLKGA